MGEDYKDDFQGQRTELVHSHGMLRFHMLIPLLSFLGFAFVYIISANMRVWPWDKARN